MKWAARVVARISVGHRKLKSEREGEVVGNGSSAGDEGWASGRGRMVSCEGSKENKGEGGKKARSRFGGERE